jgi:tRNA U38,U39,U40 pseudouridine synthase TruA
MLTRARMHMQQIRKMVGLAIYALRFKKDEERVAFVKSVMHDKEKRYVPLAPSLGLMLERYLSSKYMCTCMYECMYVCMQVCHAGQGETLCATRTIT